MTTLISVWDKLGGGREREWVLRILLFRWKKQSWVLNLETLLLVLPQIGCMPRGKLTSLEPVPSYTKQDKSLHRPGVYVAMHVIIFFFFIYTQRSWNSGRLNSYPKAQDKCMAGQYSTPDTWLQTPGLGPSNLAIYVYVQHHRPSPSIFVEKWRRHSKNRGRRFKSIMPLSQGLGSFCGREFQLWADSS